MHWYCYRTGNEQGMRMLPRTKWQIEKRVELNKNGHPFISYHCSYSDAQSMCAYMRRRNLPLIDLARDLDIGERCLKRCIERHGFATPEMKKGRKSGKEDNAG